MGKRGGVSFGARSYNRPCKQSVRFFYAKASGLFCDTELPDDYYDQLCGAIASIGMKWQTLDYDYQLGDAIVKKNAGNGVASSFLLWMDIAR
jgi:hypothetical protein